MKHSLQCKITHFYRHNHTFGLKIYQLYGIILLLDDFFHHSMIAILLFHDSHTTQL